MVYFNSIHITKLHWAEVKSFNECVFSYHLWNNVKNEEIEYRYEYNIIGITKNVSLWKNWVLTTPAGVIKNHRPWQMHLILQFVLNSEQ